MNNNLLIKLREEYDSKMEAKRRDDKTLEVLLNRKAILENSPLVMQYIELVEQIENFKSTMDTESDIALKVISIFENECGTDTNKIYQYVGSFITEGKNSRLVERDYYLAEFDKYVDIESLCEVNNPIEDREEFESNNKVIFSSDSYYDVHDSFVIDSIKDSQENATQKVLTRQGQNK